MKNKFTHHQPVRLFDIDVNNHVNNSVYFIYMEEARTKLLFDQYMQCKENGINFIVVEATCKYKIPIRIKDEVIIEIDIKNIRGASFEILYTFKNPEGSIYAVGKTQMACFDDNAKRPVRIPKGIIETIE